MERILFDMNVLRGQESYCGGHLVKASGALSNAVAVGIAIRNSLKWMKMTRGRKDEVDTRTHQNYEGYLGEGINDKN